MHRKRYLQYVAAVSGEILAGRRWTVELASMLSRRFGIHRSTAYKVLRRIYVENSGKIERHRIGKNEMKVHANMLVWRSREELLAAYLDGQKTIRSYK